jgi:hypothetical protein
MRFTTVRAPIKVSCIALEAMRRDIQRPKVMIIILDLGRNDFGDTGENPEILLSVAHRMQSAMDWPLPGKGDIDASPAFSSNVEFCSIFFGLEFFETFSCFVDNLASGSPLVGQVAEFFHLQGK